MKPRKVISCAIVCALALVLSSCSKGLSEADNLTCDVLFTSWPKVDFSEVDNYKYLRESSGISQLMDNSTSSKNLIENLKYSEELNRRMNVDPKANIELKGLVQELYRSWYQAEYNGRRLMWTIDGSESLTSDQLKWMSEATIAMSDAGLVSMKIRSECIKMGYSNS